MDTSYPDENARLRALLQEQQTTIRKMAEYNRLLSQRVAAYASEINRLKALVAKLQRMQFGKSSEKLREKTARQVREAEERISALQEEMAEVLGEQHDPVLPQPLRQSSSRKPLPAHFPAKPDRCRRQKPLVRHVAVSSAHWAATCRNSWSLSAAPLRSSKRSGQNWPAAAVTTSFRPPCRQNPSNAATQVPVCWRASSRRSSPNTRLTIVSQRYTVARAWS